MKTPSKTQLEAARAKYPPGTRVELPSGMDDEYSPIPAGTQGTVVGVDDMLGLMVDWDNSSRLNAIIGHDDIRIVPAAISDTAREQLLAMRVHPDCPNLFDAKAAFELAMRLGYYDLADFIFAETGAYSKFLLTGEAK